MFSFLVLWTTLKGQLPGECPPGTTPPVAPFCSQTCTLCDEGIDGYVGMNVPTNNWEAPPDFCAPQFHAVQWLAFVAGSTSITFNFTPTSCQDGPGLQVAIYGSSDCQSWQQVSNCDPAVPEGTTIQLDASGLTVGGTYFFVIDGNSGDFCEFLIEVVSGSTTAPDVSGTPVISGPTPLCPGSTGTYTVDGVSGAGYYNWTLDGAFIGGDQSVDIFFPDPGNYNLCVTPGNSCFGDLMPVCTTVVIQPPTTDFIVEEICFEDLPFVYQGFTFSAPGNYQFSYFLADGCEQIVDLTLNVIGPIPPTEIFADICLGDSYFYAGNVYNNTGVYPHVLTSPDGCDSIVNLNLTAHPPAFTNIGFIDHCELLGPYFIGSTPVSTGGDFSVTLATSLGCDSVVVGFLNLTTPEILFLDTTICPGGFVEIGNFTYTTPGSYNESYTEPGGCQSSFQLELDVYDPVTNIDTTICPGESVSIGGVSYSTTGSHTEVVPSLFLGLGCDSTINLNLTILPPIVTNLTEAICEGETFSVGDSTYSVQGNYTVVLQAESGCDSTVNLDLTVFPDVITTLTESICFGDAFMVGDSVFAATGNYIVPLLTSQGCDSTVYLDLTIRPAILTTLNESICDGEQFGVGSETFDTAGVYDVVLTAADGCDSTVTLNLSILEHPMTTLDEIICLGDTYSVGNSVYANAGTYMDTLAAANGCDSIITLNLQTQAPIINDITAKICTGQTYAVGSSVYTMPGMYTDTLSSSIGCDSIVNLTLSIEDVIRDTSIVSLCEGESIDVDGNTYNTTGFYDHPYITAAGCDSVFYLDLTIIPIRYTTIDSTICDGESVTVGSNVYTTTGNYEDIMPSIETGCDSIVTLNLIVLNVPVTNLQESICDGESYFVGSSTYQITGVYADTLVAANGCDSIINLDLTVLDVPETFLTPSICDGESYSVGTSIYTLTGNYIDTLVAANGCDSIIYTDLTVLDVPEASLFESICEFEVYQVGTSSYTTSGNYVDTLVAANGCDSIVSLELTVFPLKYTTLDISICNGASYPVGTSVYSISGTYVDTLSSDLTGCDSIVTLNLDVTDFYEINLNEQICEGQTYTVGTTAYNTSGNYTQMFISSDGCDSIVNLDLMVIPLPRTTIDSTICDGDTVTLNNAAYTISGTFVDTLTSFISGCDSIITLNLNVNPVFETFLNEEICEGESYAVGTFIYQQTGMYQNILTASNGCDSTVNLDLTVHPILYTSLSDTLCFGDSFSVGSSTYSETGIFVDTLTDLNGCDSIITLDLFVRPQVNTSLDETICYGDDFTVGNSTYSTTGIFVDTLTDINGCDSIITLDLFVRDEISTNLTEEICDGESFTVGITSSYTQSGQYSDTLTSILTGCDSIVFLDLTVHPIPMTNLTEEICDGENFTVGGSSSYTQSGNYIDTLTSLVTGCDSIVFLDLTVHPIPMTNLTEEICDGENFTVGGSSSYTQSGNYIDTLTSVVTGCDSIVFLDLTVHPIPMTNLTEEICDGENFTVGGSSSYTQSGNYIDTLTSVVTGCDSIVFLDLTVHPIPMTNLTEEICDGENFTVGGSSSYTQSGNYIDTLTSLVTGCDSIVFLDLTVHPIPMTNLTEEICDGENFTVGGSSSYTQSGNYIDTLTSLVTGCDSIDLTVHPIPMTNLTEEICDGENFTVGGSSSYTQSGNYIDTLTSLVTGCDSIVFLDLTVHPIPMTNLTEEICDGENFTVGGSSSYTQSGNYIDTLTSVVTGCDSIVFLDLTVHPIPMTNLTEEICDGENFTVGGSSSYTQSGNYIDTLTSLVTGCDSIVFLDLTVHPIPMTNLTEEICDGENFTVGGSSSYTQSGNYIDTLTSLVTGCDSIVFLDLTVHPIPMTNLTEEICDGENFTVGGSSSYTQSGNYIDTLTSLVTGCDSIVFLDLTVHPIPMTNLTEEICDGENFTVGGSSSYTQSGNYIDTLTSLITGCDSIVFLDLTVNPVYDVELFEDICDGDSFPIGTNSYSQTGSYINVLSTINGCDSIVTLNLTVYPCELELASTPIDASCFGYDDGSFNFALQVGTPPYEYTWQSTTNPALTGSGTITGNDVSAVVDGLPAGTYQVDIVDASPFAVTSSFQITLGHPDPVDIDMILSQFNDYNISCDEETDGAIDITATGGTPPYQYEWNTGARVEDLESLGEGMYNVTVTDANSCLDSASALLLAPPQMLMAMETLDPLCFEDETGAVFVNEVSGGVSPYMYSLNGAPFVSSPNFTNVSIGNHEIAIQDINGCIIQENVTINQAEQLLVSIGDDQEIELGEPVDLFAQTTYDVDQYIWQIDPSAVPSCTDCQTLTAYPTQSMSFAVTVIDTNNCQATDRITVFVNKKRDVYIPNVFSPNNDGQNDIFLIFAGTEAININSLRIFNRWGEPMYERYNFLPNDPTFGWDGTHRGELMNGGVYVYMAEIEFVDGEVILYKGDVTLMR